MPDQLVPPLPLPAIIGGSGMQQFPELEITERIDIETAWGSPSSPVSAGKLAGKDIMFLPRHSDNHGIAPHRVNYRANIAALAELGATHIFAFNVVGGIHRDMVAGRLVVPHQIIDYTWGREHSYSDCSGVELQHVDFTEPYDKGLREILISVSAQHRCDIIKSGVYGVTQGPRLESAAEIIRLERDGCEIVGMTAMPEAGLAREKNIPYACLALVVNPAAGKSDRLITMAEIEQVMGEGVPVASGILASACTENLPASLQSKPPLS
jgi:5'-methylthioinosine phosphorylase